MTTRDRYDHFTPIRVRYSEIDAQGIVFNAHYLPYFDIMIALHLPQGRRRGARDRRDCVWVCSQVGAHRSHALPEALWRCSVLG